VEGANIFNVGSIWWRYLKKLVNWGMMIAGGYSITKIEQLKME